MVFLLFVNYKTNKWHSSTIYTMNGKWLQPSMVKILFSINAHQYWVKNYHWLGERKYSYFTIPCKMSYIWHDQRCVTCVKTVLIGLRLYKFFLRLNHCLDINFGKITNIACLFYHPKMCSSMSPVMSIRRGKHLIFNFHLLY